MKLLRIFFPVLFFFSCSHSALNNARPEGWSLEKFKLHNRSSIGRSEGKQDFFLSGFSGLLYLGRSSSGGELFAANTDRGPNSDPLTTVGPAMGKRPFLVPQFQPRIMIVEAMAGKLNIVREVLLKDFSGAPLSGLPNLPNYKGFGDEDPVSADGSPMARHSIGLDLEGITLDEKGHWWMCDEYRPSIVEFSAEGVLLRRFVPKGTYSKEEMAGFSQLWGEGRIIESLPEELKKRTINRGFEGIAFHRGKIIASMQSPLPSEKSIIRLVQLNPISGAVELQFSYLLSRPDVDKIGDIASSPDGLLVLEQNSFSGPTGIHNIVLTQPEKVEENSELVPLSKKLISNLVALGYSEHIKVEGMAYMPDGRIAVVNDDDFGLKGAVDITNRRVNMDSSQRTELVILKSFR